MYMGKELSEKLDKIFITMRDDNDPNAMGEFHLLFSGRLAAIANAYIRQKFEIEDVVESFYFDKLWFSVKKYKNSRNPIGWVIKVFKRYLLDFINKSNVESDHKEKFCAQAVTSVDDGKYIDNHLFLGELRPLLTSFEWKLMESHMLMGFSVREVANILHIPKSTAEYRIQKLREKFKKILDEYNS